MREAIRLARENLRRGAGGPFGAVVVCGGEIVGRGTNVVTSTNDPTAHAEMGAIRDASRRLGRFHLNGCEIYTSCEPCPMCLGAIYWAHLDRVVYASTRHDAAAIGFDDEFIYAEFARDFSERQLKMEQILRDEAQQVFDEWRANPDRVPY